MGLVQETQFATSCSDPKGVQKTWERGWKLDWEDSQEGDSSERDFEKFQEGHGQVEE